MCCQFALFHYFRVEQCWERNVLAVVGRGCHLMLFTSQVHNWPPLLPERKTGHWVRSYGIGSLWTAVCLREVAARPWLVDLGSGLEMLLFEGLFTVFL